MLQSEYDNITKWDCKTKPFYEVYYLKLNDQSHGVAFWLRYTFLSPLTSPPEASVWAMFFNSTRSEKNVALKETFSMNGAVFNRTKFHLNIGGAILENNRASGSIEKGDNSISWDIIWQPSDETFRPYPLPLYFLPWPSSKYLVPNIAVPAKARIVVNGVTYDFGSILYQGHVWGHHYSNRWVWANCGAFLEDRAAVMELVSRPPIGLGYLKTSDMKMRFYLRGHYTPDSWEFSGRTFSMKVCGKVATREKNIIGVTYQDPIKGNRYCYNTKVADSMVEIYKKRKGGWNMVSQLVSNGTTAFETVESTPIQGIALRL